MVDKGSKRSCAVNAKLDLPLSIILRCMLVHIFIVRVERSVRRSQPQMMSLGLISLTACRHPCQEKLSCTE